MCTKSSASSSPRKLVWICWIAIASRKTWLPVAWTTTSIFAWQLLDVSFATSATTRSSSLSRPRVCASATPTREEACRSTCTPCRRWRSSATPTPSPPLRSPRMAAKEAAPDEAYSTSWTTRGRRVARDCCACLCCSLLSMRTQFASGKRECGALKSLMRWQRNHLTSSFCNISSILAPDKTVCPSSCRTSTCSNSWVPCFPYSTIWVASVPHSRASRSKTRSTPSPNR